MTPLTLRDWIDPRRFYNPTFRAGRLLFFWGGVVYPFLALAALGIIAGILEVMLGYYDQSPLLDAVFGAAYLGFIVCGLLISVRRLKDLGKSAWYLLWGIVPLASFILGIWLLLGPGVPVELQSEIIPPSTLRSAAATPPTQVIQKARFCHSCGNAHATDARFCISCGQQVVA